MSHSDPPRATRVWTAVLITAAVVAALLFAAGVAVWAIIGNHQDASDAKTIAVQIQLERVRNIRVSCEAQNQRHDATIAALDKLIAKVPPEQQARAQESRRSTVLLLEAIVPHRDCDALVRRQAPSG